MPYNYQEQIDYLNKNPHAIQNEWWNAKGLFQNVGFGGGCLTQIRGGYGDAYINGVKNVEITEAIRADERIPKLSRDLTIESLPAFLEWRLKIDALEGK